MKHLSHHIRSKGSINNSSTDLGEALHPQTKVDWRKTNHQPGSAEDQVSMFNLFYEYKFKIIFVRCFERLANEMW